MANRTTVIADVGDVLITTRPGAHYRALANLTDLTHTEVSERIEGADLPRLFERGALDSDAFVSQLRSCLVAPHLDERDIQDAWNAVIGHPVPQLVEVMAAVVRRHRLVFASNTNPFHWLVVRHRLAVVGLSAPAVLSFEVGFVKPESGFFRELLRHTGSPPTAVFIDDRAANVHAARTHGVDGWIHHDVDATVGRIEMMLAE